MTEVDPLPPLREVIANHGLSAKKSFGQNFLLDLNLTRKIARSVPNLEASTVIEIGPGPGGLTRALLMEGAKHVIAIEKDDRCAPVLEEIAAAFPGRLTWQNADAMDIDYNALAAGSGRPVHICANLPYNVGTALLVKWLGGEVWPPFYDSLTLMFQKEVAERITAGAGNKAYGRLAILAGWRAQARKLFDLPARAFTPPPKVNSSVVQIIPRTPVLDHLRAKDLERLSEAVFGQRRKMLRASLKQLNIKDTAFLAELGIAATARPEELDIVEICRLARAIGAMKR